MNKNNFVIEDITITEEQLTELKSTTVTRKNKHFMIKRYAGGTCACRDIPVKKVSYDIGDGSTLIEFYCQACYDKHKGEFTKRLEKMNFS